MRVPIRKPGKYTHHKLDFHITHKKLDEIKNKIDELKKVSRPEAVREVQRLAEMGDFSENAAYQMAKGRLRGINRKIEELENYADHAVVIRPDTHTDTVQLGSTVTVEIRGTRKTYTILGSLETDPHQGIISSSSPMGSALMGRKAGDVISFKIGNENVICKIVKFV